MPVWPTNTDSQADNNDLISNVVEYHTTAAGRAPEALATAPATWSLIGEHTDHAGGIVLLSLCQARVAAAISPRPDRTIHNKDIGVFPLLLERGADIHARDRDGATPLMIVALYGKDLLNQLRMLIDAGADVNARADDGRTALIYLCMTSLIHPQPAQAVGLLLDSGADPSIDYEIGRASCRERV